MAETQTPEPPGYDLDKWTAQTVIQGHSISRWASTFAEEVKFRNPNKESPKYFELANQFYTNLEMVSRGERLPGNPSDNPSYKDKLPLGGNPNPLEDMHAWLYEHADELNMKPEFIARMSMNPDERSFYNLLNTRTPTTDADFTASQKQITFQLGIERAEFLKTYFQVPEERLAGLEGGLKFGEVLTEAQRERGGSEHAIGVKEATPKEALVALTKLDIEDMNGIVPEQMNMAAKTADGKPTMERDNIKRIIELATSLNAKVGERDGNTILLASTPKEFAQIEREAKELEILTGSSKALSSYSPNLIVYQSFQDNDPNSATPGNIYSPASIVDGVEAIKNMAHSRVTGQQIDPGQSKAIDDLLDNMTLPVEDEHSLVAPRGATVITLAQAGPQSGDDFLKAHPDAHMSEKTKRQLADPGAPIRELLQKGGLDDETRKFYEETLEGIEKSGPQIFTVDPAEVPKGRQREERKPETRGDASDTGSGAIPLGIDREAAFKASLVAVYDGLKGVKHAPIEQETASAQMQHNLPQVMAENTQGKKESYLA